MPRRKVLYIRPAGWETAQHEYFRLSPLDLVVTQHYNNYALIFEKIAQSDYEIIVDTVYRALQATLGQCRHIVGTIERDSQGDFTIVKKPSSTVPFVVQRLDGTEDNCPSLRDLRKSHFCSGILGDPTRLSNAGMSMASEASPLIYPPVAGFQLTFISGGMILTTSIHHFAMDITGTNGLIQQLATHCYSLRYGFPQPTWDEALLDRSLFRLPPIPEEAKIDQKPASTRHPQWLPCTWLLFHIPRSNLYKLKQLAMPADSWISTYDALSAYLWRVLSKTRAQIYKPNLDQPAIFLESVNMRSRSK